MTADERFSPDYRSARERFLSAAERAGARIESHVLGERGLAGEELAMDVARLGPAGPRHVLAISSGLHGVEGFVGSALQLDLLSDLEAVTSRVPGLGVALVHAVNPFGFSHVDRSNERNVDLNRNFVEHPVGHRPNPDYALLAEAIAPASLDDADDAARLERLRRFAAEHGERRFEDAVSGGQYSHPRGLFYGGDAPQWSAERLLAVAREIAAGATRVAWLDVHTGLGSYGTMSLLSDLDAQAPAFRRAARWYGREAQSVAGGDGLSVVTHGSLDLALFDALEGVEEATMVTAEIGTRPPLETLLALRARNWLRHHGGGDPLAPRARALRDRLLDAFDPRERRWREAALAGGRRLVIRTLAGLAAPAS